MRFLHEKFRPTTSALSRLVAHAYERNTFYRTKLDQAGVAPHEVCTAEDLSRLPCTTRAELQSDPWLLLSVPKETLVQSHMSTGTTGSSSVYVSYDWEDLYVRGLRPLIADAPSAKLLRIDPGEIVFNALPYEVSVTGLAIHRSIQDGLGACVVPVGKGGFYSEPQKTLKMMKEIQGDHLFTTPSYAVYLAELAASGGGDPILDFGLRSIWLIGELCSNALRRRIETLWGCPAFCYYGSMEAGPIGLECAEQSGYHVATNFVALEIVDTGEDVRTLAGEKLGEVVVTPLWRYATPLIRYRTGDLAHWEVADCACGLQGRRLRVHGRREDVLVIAGRSFHVSDIEEGLLAIPEVSPWFRLRATEHELCVLLPGTDPTVAARAGELVRTWVTRHLGVDCIVDHSTSRSYTGGKFLRIARETKGESL